MRNLAVALFDPVFANTQAPIFSNSALKTDKLERLDTFDIQKYSVPLFDEILDRSPNFQRDELRNHIKAHLNRLKADKYKQDALVSSLYDLRTVLGATYAGTGADAQEIARKSRQAYNILVEAGLFDQAGDKGGKQNLRGAQTFAQFRDGLIHTDPTSIETFDPKSAHVEDPNEFELFSGGAVGSDEYFDAVAERFGISVKHFTADEVGLEETVAKTAEVAENLQGKDVDFAYRDAEDFFSMIQQREPRIFGAKSKFEKGVENLLRRNFYRFFLKFRVEARLTEQNKDML